MHHALFHVQKRPPWIYPDTSWPRPSPSAWSPLLPMDHVETRYSHHMHPALSSLAPPRIKTVRRSCQLHLDLLTRTPTLAGDSWPLEFCTRDWPSNHGIPSPASLQSCLVCRQYQPELVLPVERQTMKQSRPLLQLDNLDVVSTTSLQA